MFLQLERVYKKFELFSQAAHSIPPLALHKFALVSGAEFRFETCADIRSFDEFALAEVIFSNKRNAPDGEIFRREPVEISTGTGKILHCGLYPESEIIDAMNVALAILNDGGTPFLPRIAAFLRLPVTIKKRQKKYYDLFKETNAAINCGDLTPFALGFTAIIEETLDEAAAILKSATAKLEERGKSLRAELPNDELTQKIGNLLLQASVFFCGGLSMQELMTLTGASRNTIKSRLRQISGVEAIGVKKLFYRLKNSKE